MVCDCGTLWTFLLPFFFNSVEIDTNTKAFNEQGCNEITEIKEEGLTN